MTDKKQDGNEHELSVGPGTIIHDMKDWVPDETTAQDVAPETDAAIRDFGHRDGYGLWVKQDAVDPAFARDLERRLRESRISFENAVKQLGDMARALGITEMGLASEKQRAEATERDNEVMRKSNEGLTAMYKALERRRDDALERLDEARRELSTLKASLESARGELPAVAWINPFGLDRLAEGYSHTVVAAEMNKCTTPLCNLDAATAIIARRDARIAAAITLIKDCQNDLAMWIVPDSGISDYDVLNTLLGRLDGPQSRAVMANLRASTGGEGEKK